MKAEISNHSPSGVRDWSGVYLQQGRMLTDRDWNEMGQILARLTAEAADEAIGTGTPRHGGLVRIDGDGMILRPEGGLVAAAGLLGAVIPRADGNVAIYGNQAGLPEAVRRPRGGQAADTTQPLISRAPNGGYYYVDIWERVVTAFEAEELIDAALNGADTAFRTQRMVQLKRADADDLILPSEDPCLPRFHPGRMPEIGTARLRIEPASEIETSDDCDPCASEVTLQSAADNHLFRLELHDVVHDEDEVQRLVLKWSNDNGATELAFDEADRLRSDRSYEYFSDASEMLLGMPSDDWPSPASDWRGQLDPEDPAKLRNVMPRIREWDGWAAFRRSGASWRLEGGRANGVALTQGNDAPSRPAAVQATNQRIVIRTLDKLMTLEVAGATFLTGDSWHALSRARAPEGERIRVLSETPSGVRHRYCLLGDFAEHSGRETVLKPRTPEDLRRLNHPALTCLDAGDIGYETSCPSGLFTNVHDTVKKALDRVCSINATHVAYDPGCDLLAKANARTVAQAIDTLCDNLGQDKEEDLPRIVEISWRNDAPLELGTFLKRGLRVTCDRDMWEPCANSDNFIVEMEIPFIAGDGPVRAEFFQRILVPGRFEGNGPLLIFQPQAEKEFQDYYRNMISRLADLRLDYAGIRFRVTLKSESILDESGKLHLDGEALKIPSKLPDGSGYLPIEGQEQGRMRTGNGKRGGDFESWFYLVNEERVTDPNRPTEPDEPVITLRGNRLLMLVGTRGEIGANFTPPQLEALEQLISLSNGNPDLRGEIGNVQPDITLDASRRANRAAALAAFRRMNVEGSFVLASTQELASAAKIIAENVRQVTENQFRLDPQPFAEETLVRDIVRNRASLILVDSATGQRLGSIFERIVQPLVQF